jgi:hypothetical protein
MRIKYGRARQRTEKRPAGPPLLGQPREAALAQGGARTLKNPQIAFPGRRKAMPYYRIL